MVAPMVKTPALTVGIEEEYLLVDPRHQEPGGRPAGGAVDGGVRATRRSGHTRAFACTDGGGHQAALDIQDLAADLKDLRKTVGRCAGDHGAKIIAASTHPFALWWEQLPTDKERYQTLNTDLGVVANRLVISGMHVHAGIEDPDLRIDLMSQVCVLPPAPAGAEHVIAVLGKPQHGTEELSDERVPHPARGPDSPSTSTPGPSTSVTSRRARERRGLIPDASKLWWDIQTVRAKFPDAGDADLGHRHPLDGRDHHRGAVPGASLHMLFRLRRSNQRWRHYANMLVSENVWRAQRYGTTGDLMDFGRPALVPFAELIDELIELLRPDAEELGCVTEVEHARQIARDGTSAARQIDTYETALENGSSEEDALKAVVDQLISETLAGT